MKKSESIGSLRSGDSSQKRVHLTNGSTTYETAVSALSPYSRPYDSTAAGYIPGPSYGDIDAVSPTMSYDSTGVFGPTTYGVSNVDDIIELSDAGWCTASRHLDNGNFGEKSPYTARQTLSTSRVGNRTSNNQSNAVTPPPAAAFVNGYSHSSSDRRIRSARVNDVGKDSSGVLRSAVGGVSRSSNKRSPSRSRLAIKFVGGELSSTSGLPDHTSSGSQPRTSSSSRNASVDTGPSFEELSSEHFPYTLHRGGAGVDSPGLNGGSGTIKDQRGSGSGRYASAMNHHRHHRGSSTRSSSSSTSTSSTYDRGVYLLDDHNLTSPTVLMSTPYQFDLAHLHLEKLRIEEENLLELKRQAELERIRGPQPKWYEMKSTGFHQEVHKHNKLMKNRQAWQALYDYRTELEEASRKYRESDSKRGSEES